MSVAEPKSHARSLIDRAKAIILKPSEEWTKIEAERPTAVSLYLFYAMPLAAVPVIAGMIGSLAFGIGGAMSISADPVRVLIGGVLDYVISIAMVAVTALIINALAETFNGRADRMQALKASVYSWTAIWLVGVVSLIPPLWPLGLLSLYSVFLLYRALPIVMKAPVEQAIGYSAAIIGAALVAVVVMVAVRAGLLSFA